MNGAQELTGAQSASKQLEQRVKELEGLLKDRDVRVLCIPVRECLIILESVMA